MENPNQPCSPLPPARLEIGTVVYDLAVMVVWTERRDMSGTVFGACYGVKHTRSRCFATRKTKAAAIACAPLARF